MENVIIDRSVVLFCPPLLSILCLKTPRNELARPVMGTIFLVISKDENYSSR